MPGFNLSHKKPHSKPVVDEFCLQQCKKLRDFVKKMRWSPISRTPKKWSDSVRLLRNDLCRQDSFVLIKQSELVISTVLDKYLSLSQSIGFAPDKTGGFPKCKDMAQFRRCWDWINNVIAKHERDNPVNVTVSDQAKSIATILKRKSWPAGCLDKLETAVQVSLDNFNTFTAKLKRDFVFGDELRKFYSKILNNLGTPTQFVADWFESTHKRVADWSDWNGNLMLEVFKPESKSFHKWGKSVSVAWSGKTDLWYKLSERLGISK